MTRNSNFRSVKPRLEALEDRCLPSFLLSQTTVVEISTAMNHMVTDMQKQATDLQNKYTFLQNNSMSPTQAQNVYGQMASDWTRMTQDHTAVNNLQQTSITVINIIVVAEAQEGDPIDWIILHFGSLFGMHPLSPLDTPVNNANGMWNQWTTPGTTQHGIVFGNLQNQNSSFTTTPLNDIVTANV